MAAPKAWKTLKAQSHHPNHKSLACASSSLRFALLWLLACFTSVLQQAATATVYENDFEDYAEAATGLADEVNANPVGREWVMADDGPVVGAAGSAKYDVLRSPELGSPAGFVPVATDLTTTTFTDTDAPAGAAFYRVLAKP
jgi:hypothetical protein